MPLGLSVSRIPLKSESELTGFGGFLGRDDLDEYHFLVFADEKEPFGRSARYVGRQAQMIAEPSWTQAQCPRRIRGTVVCQNLYTSQLIKHTDFRIINYGYTDHSYDTNT